MVAGRKVFGFIEPSDVVPYALRPEWPAMFQIAGERANLSAAHPHAGSLRLVLEEARENGIPVLIALDAAGIIQEVQTPLPADGVAVMHGHDNGDVEVNLYLSHTRHMLLRSDPNFKDLHAALEAAMQSGTEVVLVETDDHAILHVEVLNRPFDHQAGALDFFRSTTKAILAVTLRGADQLFGEMNGLSCSPDASKDPCIPFLYPDDGCYARAHEMCRLIGHAKTGKVWNYGNLNARTPNHPNCAVNWVYHVAPTVLVKLEGSTVSYVIDPSLFTKPVTVAVWTNAQGDSHSETVETESEIYYRNRDGSTVKLDPNHANTKEALRMFRLQLMKRTPPYAACMGRSPEWNYLS